MSEEESNRRSYHSPLRRQQQDITRNQIMKAVAEIINEGRILSFTVKDVSDRAGVSYGTVYRHFPTRESLLETLYEYASEKVGQEFSLKSTSIEELTHVLRKTAEAFEENFTILQAYTMALAANNIQPSSRRERDRKYLEMVAESAPFLAPEVAGQIAAIISHLHSSLTWVTLRQRFELSAEDTTDALTWAIRVLIQDLIQQKGEA
ncbi:TetR/AcrR family transcriptional regulator [Desulfitobacterium sp. Sab5]|uniref:TetR/AcrR family transcriptional regulator n=1 Tax=Desulfitobacterium nosdiversum TaxID=3375356 RepID=UPI003CE6B197